MTSFDQDDTVMRLLARLEAPEPNAARAGLLRDRCQRALTRRERWCQRRRQVRHQLIEISLVGGLALVFVVGMIIDLVRWHER